MKNIYTRIRENNTIKIPSKLIKTINYFTDEELLTITSTIEEAKELIYLFLSLFTGQSINYSKTLMLEDVHISNDFFRKMFSDYKKKAIYKLIINLLVKGTKNGSILYLRNKYSVAIHRANGYVLSDRYIGYGYDLYTIKTKKAIKVKQRLVDFNLSKIENEIIAKRELLHYDKLSCFNDDEVKKISEEKKYNKGKKIVYRKSKNFNTEEQTLYSSLLNQYKYYNENDNLIVPIISSDRVYTSINLISSFIRKEINIDGEESVELDFSALHPSIILSLYGDVREKKNQITHTNISNELKVDREEIKTIHLSFFNDRINNILNSKKYNNIRDYYFNKYPVMMKNLIEDKEKNGYKITSQRTLKIEKEIMERVYRRIDINIPMFYIFDALKVKKSDANLVAKVMNDVVNEMNILTEVDYKIKKKIKKNNH